MFTFPPATWRTHCFPTRALHIGRKKHHCIKNISLYCTKNEFVQLKQLLSTRKQVSWLDLTCTDGGQIKGNLNKRVEKHIKCRCFCETGLTEWFEYENDVNKVLRPLQSPDLNPVSHLWKILDQCVRQSLHHYTNTKWYNINFYLQIYLVTSAFVSFSFCLLYSGLSCKRDLDLSEITWFKLKWYT